MKQPSPQALALGAFALALASTTTLTGCPLLEGLAESGALNPTVSASAPELRRAPSLADLAGYYCPRVIDQPVVQLTCSALFGPPPAQGSLGFTIGITLAMDNPNDIPIPALDTLLALTLFDGADAEALGAVCVGFCGADDPTCDGSPPPGACSSDQDAIRTLEDFGHRLPGLISDTLSGETLDELRGATLAAGGALSVDLAFDLGLEQALSVFEKTALIWVQDLMSGRNASLAVPVSGEGSVFFDLPVVGRFGVGYGPISGTWDVR